MDRFVGLKSTFYDTPLCEEIYVLDLLASSVLYDFNAS